MVTIGIGIIGKQDGQRPAIIFASDSQTTYGAPKSLDAQKISIVDFKDAQIMVNQAGSAQLGDRVIDEMRKIARDRELENCESGAEVAQQAIREIRKQLFEIKKDAPYSDAKQICLDNPLELIVAYYFNREPFMFTVDIDRAIYFRLKSAFASIGIGDIWQNFYFANTPKPTRNFNLHGQYLFLS